MVWRKIDIDIYVNEVTYVIEKVRLSKLKEQLKSLEVEFTASPLFDEIKAYCLTAKNSEEFLQKTQKCSSILNLSSEIKRLEELIKLLEGL